MNKITTNNAISVVILFILTSCSNVPNTKLEQPKKTKEDNSTKVHSSVSILYHPDLAWLNYADPVAEASLAIAKHDYTLLAFAGRGNTLPGIKSENADWASKHCGVKILPASSDALKNQQALDTRQRLYQYAMPYNILVMQACQASLGE